MSNAFQWLLKILDEEGVSPDRVGQIETEDGTLYEESAPVTFVDEEGAEVIIKPDGSIWAYGEQVAQMELREDAWYQAQEMIWLEKQYTF